ncbi:hypothetical protein C8R47DRAFT_1129144 [Mycena vitilis]|nr:hypothetical protein C8R47DRAFT_1129144 [Mycena vitilis]
MEAQRRLRRYISPSRGPPNPSKKTRREAHPASTRIVIAPCPPTVLVHRASSQHRGGGDDVGEACCISIRRAVGCAGRARYRVENSGRIRYSTPESKFGFRRPANRHRGFFSSRDHQAARNFNGRSLFICVQRAPPTFVLVEFVKGLSSHCLQEVQEVQLPSSPKPRTIQTIPPRGKSFFLTPSLLCPQHRTSPIFPPHPIYQSR